MHLLLQDVAVQYGDRNIFAGLNLSVSAGERLALIGENGSGKSTLLRIVTGELSPSAGRVTLDGSAALLRQDTHDVSGTVLQTVTPSELAQARTDFEAASLALSDPTPQALEAFGQAEEVYRALGGYDFKTRAQGVLAGLQLDPAARLEGLSGGQARRVMLARLLLSPADLYLLDEPTNHLDAPSVAWLESWIRESPAAFVLASHDRAFLDATATRVAELERGELHEYPGNFSQAMELKATLRAAQQRDFEAYRRKSAALKEEMQRRQSKARSANQYNPKRAHDNDKFLARGKAENAQMVNASRAKALEKRLEQLHEVEKPYQDGRLLSLDLPTAPPGPNEVLSVHDLDVQLSGHTILQGVNLELRRGERLALTGPNGSGKSTFLKAVLGQIMPTSGSSKLGQGLSLYWAGQHGEELDGLPTLSDALLDANSHLTRHQLYELAASTGLPPDPDFLVADLSGGQRTRLSLARLGVTRAQLLVLDEPTNHLDIRAIEALEELLLGFPGTVLFASHDRRLLERVATQRLEFEEVR